MTATATLVAGLLAAPALAQTAAAPKPLNLKAQPKFQNRLTVPPVATKVPGRPGFDSYQIEMVQSTIRTGLVDPKTNSKLKTPVWLYADVNRAAGTAPTMPGPTIVATKGTPVAVRWLNNLPNTGHLFAGAYDSTLGGATVGLGQGLDPAMRTTVHMHGAEVPIDSDGHPEDTFWPGGFRDYHYPMQQDSALIWYHDHALASTRLNVSAGLFGGVVVVDPAVDLPGGPLGMLPLADAYDIPLVITDRNFNADGTIAWPTVGVNPEVHPQWIPEYFGDVPLVNGTAWPWMKVEQRKYRFRIINGCNARFLSLALRYKSPVLNVAKGGGPDITVIGTDGGYLRQPAVLDPSLGQRLVIAPGERADIIVDFTHQPKILPTDNRSFILENTAASPYPNGAPPTPGTIDQIMEFRVGGKPTKPDFTLPNPWPTPEQLNNAVVPTQDAAGNSLIATRRQIFLNEMMGAAGPLASMINGKVYDPNMAAITETPTVGTTEIWEFANVTGDTHPIHLHLVRFQVLDRYNFDVEGWLTASGADPLNPMTFPNPQPFDAFLLGPAIAPDATEAGFKDTAQVPPGQVTRYIVKFGPVAWPSVNPGTASEFNFLPPTDTSNPLWGYMYHCHIIDHEDNEMMRPYQLKTEAQTLPAVIPPPQ